MEMATQSEAQDTQDGRILHEWHIPLDDLRNLYFRPALGSGYLIPSTPPRPAHPPAAAAHYNSAAFPTYGSRQRFPSSGSTSSFGANQVQTHPQSHVQIHSAASNASIVTLASSASPSQFARSVSYVHAPPGSSAGGYDNPYPPTRVLTSFEKRRILVTGGAGFVGSHLVDRLMLMGHEVIVLDNFFTGQKSNLSHWIGHPNFELLRHDVVNPLLIEIDQIYHLACPASPISYQANQVKTIKTNFIGTLNTLGLAKRTKARFLLASTSEVYGDPDVHPQPEWYNGNVNPTGPRACYDEGKRVAETLTYGYFYQDGVDVRVARIFNTYGPRMQTDDGRVVSNFIVQALKGEPLTIFGDGSQTRSFMFIHDLIDGLIGLMNAEPSQNPDHQSSESQPPDLSGGPTSGDVDQPVPDLPHGGEVDHRSDVHSPVNLGNPAEFTVRELADLVAEVVEEVKNRPSARSTIDGGDDGIRQLPMPKDDPRQRRPDTTRARELLDWEPRWMLRDGLKEMATFYWDRMKEGSL
ncbi:NAD(P)-binding protein [Violaceomyces palustris]|uniref:NAD(P)-binding protein n=1 Tax=Violaceomyces palustris TaxID=1673888 RepID=A0ACD0NYW9_9BASI|nr:NAD(P)-binding protein [Violaceomyces palustris]